MKHKKYKFYFISLEFSRKTKQFLVSLSKSQHKMYLEEV